MQESVWYCTCSVTSLKTRIPILSGHFGIYTTNPLRCLPRRAFQRHLPSALTGIGARQQSRSLLSQEDIGKASAGLERTTHRRKDFDRIVLHVNVRGISSPIPYLTDDLESTHTSRTSRHYSQGRLRRESVISQPLYSKCTTLRSGV